MRFSDLVTELTEMWLEWMKENTIARSDNYDFVRRREAAERCEILIAKEYELVERMDRFFDKGTGIDDTSR